VPKKPPKEAPCARCAQTSLYLSTELVAVQTERRALREQIEAATDPLHRATARMHYDEATTKARLLTEIRGAVRR